MKLNKFIKTPMFYDTYYKEQYGNFLVGDVIYFSHPLKYGKIIKAKLKDIIKIQTSNKNEWVFVVETWFKKYSIKPNKVFHSKAEAINESENYNRWVVDYEVLPEYFE